MAKIGIMGGTFDPIHNGHLSLGKQAYREYRLDEIWYMPTGQPPHKTDHQVTAASMRCEMTALGIQNEQAFRLCDVEVKREGYSYTANTLKLLRRAYPEHEFYFIIGADSLYEIEGWYHPEEVMSQANLLVARREYEDAQRPVERQIRYLSEKYQARILLLHTRKMNIASAELRVWAAAGKSIRAYVPDSVADYIENHHLYQKRGFSHE